MAEYKGILSKDNGGRVPVPKGSEEKSYYKYYLEPMQNVSEELQNKIRQSVFEKGMGLEVIDRNRLTEIKAFPQEPGCYELSGGGALSCANVKTPHLTGEMMSWWMAWHGLEPLRYAIWNPEDHYDVEVVENKERLFDETIPIKERFWGTTHKLMESMVGDEPSEVSLSFLNPAECGYDSKMLGTDRWLFAIIAQGMNGPIPAFATEVLAVGEDGVNEMRSRFWFGYELQQDGTVKYKLPESFEIPKELLHNLVIHNYKEFSHLDKILPRLYEEEKGVIRDGSN